VSELHCGEEEGDAGASDSGELGLWIVRRSVTEFGHQLSRCPRFRQFHPPSSSACNNVSKNGAIRPCRIIGKIDKHNTSESTCRSRNVARLQDRFHIGGSIEVAVAALAASSGANVTTMC
jgi:hypothetical protein